MCAQFTCWISASSKAQSNHTFSHVVCVKSFGDICAKSTCCIPAQNEAEDNHTLQVDRVVLEHPMPCRLCREPLQKITIDLNDAHCTVLDVRRIK